jgi:dienelactone hydrolase
MYRNLFFLLSLLSETLFATTEYMDVSARDEDYTIAYEIFYPDIGDNFPAIIHIHGSNRDGRKLSDGVAKTDEMGKRLIIEGNKIGYAVIPVDIFYSTDLEPSDKGRFPPAGKFVKKLKTRLSKNNKLDKSRFFLTGFSYGGGQVMKFVSPEMNYPEGYAWSAIGSAAPGCSRVLEPTKVDYPILMIKGELDHYPFRACEWYRDELVKLGNSIELKVLKKVNHFFSTPEGYSPNTPAMNGCTDNPVITYLNGDRIHVDGTVTSRKKMNRDCLTIGQVNSGKTDRLKLNEVINLILSFFEKVSSQS